MAYFNLGGVILAPKRIHNRIFIKGNVYEFVCICMYVYLLLLQKTAKSDEDYLLFCLSIKLLLLQEYSSKYLSSASSLTLIASSKLVK